MLRRMRFFIISLIRQCNVYRLPCELIVVEWNPPAERPLLHEVLPAPVVEDHLQIRYMVVPAEVHGSFENPAGLPLHQMIAKNAGIRRAGGEFIACTNIDVLFTDELFSRLAERKLSGKFFYRANRCDVIVPDDVNDPELLLREAGKNIIRRWGMDHRYPGLKVFSQDFFMYRSSFFRPLYPLLQLAKRCLLGKWSYRIARLDKEASGDFTMMSKAAWTRINGYPEFPLYPAHIDSMALIAADAEGLEQYIFPPEACIYHLEHEGGWRPGKHRGASLEWREVNRMGKELLKNKTPFPYSTDNWGLPGHDLGEISF